MMVIENVKKNNIPIFLVELYGGVTRVSWIMPTSRDLNTFRDHFTPGLKPLINLLATKKKHLPLYILIFFFLFFKGLIDT